MDGLSGAASIIATAQLCEKVIKYINTVSGAKEDRKHLRGHIRECSTILLRLKDGAEDSEEDIAWSETLRALDSPLKNLHAVLDMAAKHLLSTDSNKEKLKWPFKEKEVRKLVESIECEKSLLSLALENNSARLLHEIAIRSKDNNRHLTELTQLLKNSTHDIEIGFHEVHDRLSTLQVGQTGLSSGILKIHDRQNEHEASQERRDILNWLTPVDHAAQQQDAISRRQEGTGEWLLSSKEYQTWMKSNDRTLFCPGIPGAGKTICTSIINEDLWQRYHNDSTVGLAFLFCNFKRQQEQTIENLLAGLLKQLAERQTPLPKFVKELYAQHGRGQRRPSLTTILQTLKLVMTTYTRAFIVVDALDECPSGNGCRTKLISEIKYLQHHCKINILATSRFIPEITQDFEETQRLEIRASRHDVRMFLDAHMHQLPNFVKQNTILQEDIRKGIVDSVDGMFLLAQLHFDSLVGKRSAKAVRAALDNLITGSGAYDAAYTAAMERIEGQVADQRDLAKQALAWITCARRPLSTSELQAALGVEVGEPELDPDNLPDVNDIVSTCAGLVTVDKESHIIRLVHYTTQEFFERTQQQWFPDAQTMITNVCTTYLAFDVFGNPPPTGELWIDSSRGSDLYAYSAREWGHHARMASSSHTQANPHVMSFLNRPFNVTQAAAAIRGPFVGRYPKPEPNATALHLAAHFGLEAAAATILQRSSDPDVRDEYGRTPLMFAAHQGHESIVQLLLNYHATVDCFATERKNTALYYAAEEGWDAIVRLLLVHGAGKHLEQAENSFYVTPLHNAAGQGRIVLVELFLSCNISTGLKNAHGHTPLHYAAAFGNAAMVQLLLKANAVVDSKDEDSFTPLHLAAVNGHAAVVQLLLEANAAVDSKNKDGSTPLHSAAHFSHVAIVEILLTHGACVDSMTHRGMTPLILSALHEHEEGGECEAVVRKLLAAGANVHSKDRHGMTALFHAAKNGHCPPIELLVEAGAVVDSLDEDANTPLILACEHGDKAAVELLIRAGADIHHKNWEGRSALMEASREAHEEVLLLLLQKRADPNVRDQDDRSALSELEEILAILDNASKKTESEDEFINSHWSFGQSVYEDRVQKRERYASRIRLLKEWGAT
ncbi:Nn.00g079430.m01.CDS01 [Neocucurbitaria sp. VM-36]